MFKTFVLRMTAIALLLSLSTQLRAMHDDVEFGYNNLTVPSSFVIEGDNFTWDNLLYFSSKMEEFDPFNPGDFGSDEPGFTTNPAEGFLINPGDRIFLRVLNATDFSTYGVGYVNFYNPNTGFLEASADRRLSGDHNTGSLQTLFFNGLGIETGDNPLFLGAGNASGNLHDHIFFDLLDDNTAPFGAYGVLLRLESDFASNGFNGIDLVSDPFWFIWNHGMTSADFNQFALPAFGAIPEPNALLVVAAIGGFGLARRRRR
ncbi:MAG TPA: PEP-CTERM sorting domain-containing protein [Pirellulaceae bacterium]|nr:PEP-CTERM sorting domain-containing protein [Pirellulaceae bacterium]HMO92269.1 PEP-CTERM sorting domain-containing protein [Pirellulaceae bacterium]HMP70086.1 PEP-CTERM sorting domain-containing protein [Pirellulaceae bacterium]